MDDESAPSPQGKIRNSRRLQVLGVEDSSSNVGSCIRRKSGTMQEHLEDIEAFCKVVKNVGSKERNRLLRQSLLVQAGTTKQKKTLRRTTSMES
jgi:hypothetical protein